MKFSKTKKWLLLLGCAVSAIYLLLVLMYDANVLERNLAGDGGSYINAMLDLDYHQLHRMRPPAYPAFLLGLKYLSSTNAHHYILIHAIQFILWIISLVLLLRFMPDKKSKLWSALFLLLVFNPSFVQYSNMILTEIVFLFLIILSFVFLKSFFDKQKENGLLGSITCLLLATLVRPGLLYFTLIALIISLIYSIKKNRVITTVCLVGLSIIFLALPMRIMKNTHGHYTISYIDKITQYRYQNARVASLIQDTPLGAEMKERTNKTFVKDKNELANLIKNIQSENKKLIAEYPIQYAQSFGQNLFLNFHAGNEFLPTNIPIIGKHFYGLSRILNMLFVILLLICIPLFAYRFFSTKNKFGMIFPGTLLAYCFYCWLTSGVSFFQGDRFNVVWMPILVIFMFQFFNKNNYEKR